MERQRSGMLSGEIKNKQIKILYLIFEFERFLEMSFEVMFFKVQKTLPPNREFLAKMLQCYRKYIVHRKLKSYKPARFRL